MTGNKLTNLGVLLRFTLVHSLQVAENEIQYLTENDFAFSNAIIKLELQKNEIRRIDTDAFKKLKRLQSLDLSSNLITSLNGSVKYLNQLRRLNLENNSIQVTRFFLISILVLK